MHYKIALRGLATTALLLVTCCCSNPSNKLVNCQTCAPNGDDIKSEKPALFTFEQFKVSFHKTYKSISEELWRNSVFICRLMESAVSYCSYKHKQSSSFERLNKLSDRTNGEFKQTLMNAEEYYKAIGENQELSGEFVGYLKANLEKGDISLADVLESQNIVFASKASRGWLSSWGNGVLSVANKLGNVAERALQSGISKLLYNKGEYRPDLPDEIYIDHRTKTNCLTRVRDQDDCGACYSFSTIALYEWAYCVKEGARIKFSEQYLVDCGHMASSNLKGCDSGNEFAVSEFLARYGFELLDRYRYKGIDQKCPYDNQEEKEKMGYLRMDKPNLAWVYPHQFDEEIKVNPFIVTIYPSNRLPGYGGGVDDGKGCGNDLSDLHSVLLVGSGRQDGYEYWIIRNSYGSEWGEDGYYRMRKDSSCLASLGLGIKLKHKQNRLTEFIPKYEYSINPNYDWKILARQFDHKTPPRLPPKPRN